MSDLLCYTGVLLFVIGLLTGFAIPRFRSPRIGLSAHLASTQSGVALIAFGLLWSHLDFWPGWSAPLADALWLSFYVLWFGLVLGAAWGTGRSLPIAGAGFQATKTQERTAIAFIVLGSLGSLGALIAVLFQWKWIG